MLFTVQEAAVSFLTASVTLFCSTWSSNFPTLQLTWWTA